MDGQRFQLVALQVWLLLCVLFCGSCGSGIDPSNINSLLRDRPFEAVASLSLKDTLAVFVTMIKPVIYTNLKTATLIAQSIEPFPDLGLSKVPVSAHAGIHLNQFSCLIGSHQVPAIHVSQQTMQCMQPPVALQSLMVGLPIHVSARGFISASKTNYALPQSPLLTSTSETPKLNLCGCLMLWQRSKFLDEWATYYRHTGLEAVFICDNESTDDVPAWVDWLSGLMHTSYKYFPGDHMHQGCLSYCSLLAQDRCEWLAFTDIDEFLFQPTHPDRTLAAFLMAQDATVGAVVVRSLAFLPSNQTVAPAGGVIRNYSCRKRTVEHQYKTIARVKALHPASVNRIHQHLLRRGFVSVAYNETDVVLFHYKLQAWDEYRLKKMRRAGMFSRVRPKNREAYPEPSLFFNSTVRACVNLSDTTEYVVDWRLRNYVLHTTTNKKIGDMSSVYSVHQSNAADAAGNTLVVGTGGLGSGLTAIQSFLSQFDGSGAGIIAVRWPLLVRDTIYNYSRLQHQFMPPAPNYTSLTFRRVIHHTRHPLPAIAAIVHSYSSAEWAFVARHTPTVRLSDPPLRRALRHWLGWNLLAERVADAQYRVEDVTGVHLCTLIARSCPKETGRILFARNKSQDAVEQALTHLTWEHLSAADPLMVKHVRQLASRYGYTEDYTR